MPAVYAHTHARTGSHRDTQPIIFTSTLLSLIFNKPMRPRANKEERERLDRMREPGRRTGSFSQRVLPPGLARPIVRCPRDGVRARASLFIPRSTPSADYLFPQLIYNARKYTDTLRRSSPPCANNYASVMILVIRRVGSPVISTFTQFTAMSAIGFFQFSASCLLRLPLSLVHFVKDSPISNL